MAQVYFPRALVAIIADLPDHVEVTAPTLADLIAALDTRWPGVQMRLCANSTLLRQHIKVFIDGEQATLAMPIRNQAVVRIMTAVSGG